MNFVNGFDEIIMGELYGDDKGSLSLDERLGIVSSKLELTETPVIVSEDIKERYLGVLESIYAERRLEKLSGMD